MLRYHDFSRFGLLGGEIPTYYAAFDMGMEGLITDRRFIYRDAGTGETWAIEFARLDRIAVFGHALSLGGDWNLCVWLSEPLDPAEDQFQRDLWGDLRIPPVDTQQAHEVGARLAAAIEAAYVSSLC